MIEKNKFVGKNVFSAVGAARGKNSPLDLGNNSKIWNQIWNPWKSTEFYWWRCNVFLTLTEPFTLLWILPHCQNKNIYCSPIYLYLSIHIFISAVFFTVYHEDFSMSSETGKPAWLRNIAGFICQKRMLPAFGTWQVVILDLDGRKWMLHYTIMS